VSSLSEEIYDAGPYKCIQIVLVFFGFSDPRCVVFEQDIHMGLFYINQNIDIGIHKIKVEVKLYVA